jgi:hypothetical protein
MLQLISQLGFEFGIITEAQVLLAQLFHGWDERLGHIDAAELAEVTA